MLSHSVVSDPFAIPWTVARQAPLPMGFSKARILQQARSCRLGQYCAAGAPHTLHCWHQGVDLALQSSGFFRWRQSKDGTWAGLRLDWKGWFLSCGEREWTPSLSWTPSNDGGSVDESEVTQPLRKRKGYGEPRDGGGWSAYGPRGHAYFSCRFWL